ncbi:MAG: sigma-54 dependent transcriptional regulator [Gammaproteobacteria bacterium]|nr:sigma-54 dependent transcriptional regulator [Gammaproteobacteria bacterium]
MSRPSVLIVEDDASLREALTDTLQIAGYGVLEAENGNVALETLENANVGMVISDVQMDGMDGHTLLKKLRELHPEIPAVLMTAYGTIEKAVEAMQDGAIDYLVKPFEAEVLVNMVANYVLSEDIHDEDMVAEDPKTKEVLSLVAKVADSEATVLVSGESGTGKEVFAHQIHAMSPRHKGPFIALNCAAIPENMLEAMLFGYEKGAFTGAYKSSPGKFELANAGTLLLDEISEMDIGLQAKLLRVLQEREVERLGGNKLIPLDVRVLATTNRDMKKEVADGRFREDLYYRLNVFPIHLPPLRERKKDVIPMMQFLIRRHTKGHTGPTPELTSAAQEKLLTHSWPGNVRELDNVSQRALILQSNNRIDVDQIMFEPESMNSDSPGTSTGAQVATSTAAPVVEESAGGAGQLGDSLRNREHHLILDALKAARGSRKTAAENLGVSQRTLRYKLARMREDGIEVPSAYGNY